MILSDKSKSLWAKKSKGLWLPLYAHMADSAGVAKKLWEHWLPNGVKNNIIYGIEAGSEEAAQKLLVFLAAAHDLGKATPIFQSKPSLFKDLDKDICECTQRLGIPLNSISFSNSIEIPHAAATQMILESYGVNKGVAAILGGHHGKPQNRDSSIRLGVDANHNHYHLGSSGKDVWQGIQYEFLDYALYLAKIDKLSQIPKVNALTQTLLCGFVIMVDWIASNEEIFHLINVSEIHMSDFEERVNAGWKELALPTKWEGSALWTLRDLYAERFNLSPNSVQTAAVEIAKEMNSPGIMVIEAPMGIGKTEAALAAAEVLACATGCAGVFFALPTQAASNGIFPRLLKWVESLGKEAGENYSIRLSHGRAQFNEKYQKLFEGGGSIYEEGGATVHNWFNGRKKSLLADFVIGTVDQLLMMALKQKHVMLRHLGLAGKVVIIDECHAYDAYMNVYLKRALAWLGKYSVPVIVLSATLSLQRRKDVIQAYVGGRITNDVKQCPAYPVITYSHKGEIRRCTDLECSIHKEVAVQSIGTDSLADILEERLTDGGYAGVIVNTVECAQKIAVKLRRRFGEDSVSLLHAHFLAPDRDRMEAELLSKLGRDGNRSDRLIVVGTQVLEQSLDIDFDILATDLCPMDLLLQRMGRLHRHKRERSSKLSKAHCLVMEAEENFEKGAHFIYGNYLLARTKRFLPDSINMPKDIAALVQNVYDEQNEEEAREYLKNIKDKESKARDFLIDPPTVGFDKNILGFLDAAISDQKGEATVRDSEASIEVIVVRNVNGVLCFLPWTADGYGDMELATAAYDDEAAKVLARQRVRLPYALCAHWKVDETIKALEHIFQEYNLGEWCQSPWLQGELFLVLDECYSAELCGYDMRYSKEDGLICTKSEARGKV